MPCLVSPNRKPRVYKDALFLKEAEAQLGSWKKGGRNRPRAERGQPVSARAHAEQRRASSRPGGRLSRPLCQSRQWAPLGQVPIFIIKATFLGFLGDQALITGESKHQRKILI